DRAEAALAILAAIDDDRRAGIARYQPAGAGATAHAGQADGAGTTVQRAADGADELVDAHRRVAVRVACLAVVDRRVAESDVHTHDQLVDGDREIGAAIASARLREGSLR